MKAPKQTNPPTPGFLLPQKARALEKKSVANVSIPEAFSPPASLSRVLLIPSERALRTYRGSSQGLPLNQLGKTTVQTKNESHGLTDPRAAFLGLNSTPISQVLSQSMKTVQIEGVSHKPQQVLVSAPLV